MMIKDQGNFGKATEGKFVTVYAKFEPATDVYIDFS